MYEPDSSIMYSQLPSKITESIFLGSEKCSEYDCNLFDLGITHILVAGKTLETPFPEKFIYYKVDLLDDEEEDLISLLDKIVEFIDNCISNKGKVLVHCAAGLSRSPSCIIAYFIKKYNYTYEESVDLIKKGRRNIDPNKGFQKQLKAYYEIQKNKKDK